MKFCPICETDKTEDEFGVCRSRPDGKNLYCKPCIREKITKSRREARAYREAQTLARAKAMLIDAGVIAPLAGRKPNRLAIKRLPDVSDLANRVVTAISHGAVTQYQMVRFMRQNQLVPGSIRQSRDETVQDFITDALAELIIEKRKVGYVKGSEPRRYFVKEAA